MKKFEYPPDLNFRLRIQAPSGKHTAFRVLKIYSDSDKIETLKDSSLTSINDALKDQKLTKEEARKDVELFVERIYREAGVKKFKVVSNSDNMRVLTEFWDKEYKARRLVDKESTYAKYRRAIEALGDLSVRAASQEDIQEKIDSKYRGNKQREIVGRLHSILAYLGRSDVRLVLEPEEETEVKYVTREELEVVLSNIESDIFKLACRVARGTGARIGELLAMKREHIKDGGKQVFIKHQVRRSGVTALAKSKKADSPGRTVYVLPEARKLLPEWVLRKNDFSIEMRRNAANIIKAAAMKAFPNAPEKWLKFHDLRHSYAIELAQSGVSLLQISQLLGNSEAVCQKHYTGFMATDESLDLIEAKVKQAAKLRKAQ